MSERTIDVERENSHPPAPPSKGDFGGDEQVFVPRLIDGQAQIMVNLQVYALPVKYAGRRVRVTTNPDGTLYGVTTMLDRPVTGVEVASAENKSVEV